MAVRLNLFSNTEQDTKKVSTVEELPQYKSPSSPV